MRKEDQNLKTLCNIISPEPTDDEGAETQYEAGMEFSDEYDLLEMHTNFGNDDYKEIYNSVINKIRVFKLPIQMTLCKKLIEKLYETYSFEFRQNIDLVTQDDMDQVYKLVEFLQFDNLRFATTIWKSFNIKNLMGIDLEQYFFINKEVKQKLIEQITNNSLMYKNTLINEFLTTCEGDQLVLIFFNMTEKNRANISVNLMRGTYE